MMLSVVGAGTYLHQAIPELNTFRILELGYLPLMRKRNGMYVRSQPHSWVSRATSQTQAERWELKGDLAGLPRRLAHYG